MVPTTKTLALSPLDRYGCARCVPDGDAWGFYMGRGEGKRKTGEENKRNQEKR